MLGSVLGSSVGKSVVRRRSRCPYSVVSSGPKPLTLGPSLLYPTPPFLSFVSVVRSPWCRLGSVGCVFVGVGFGCVARWGRHLVGDRREGGGGWHALPFGGGVCRFPF